MNIGNRVNIILEICKIVIYKARNKIILINGKSLMINKLKTILKLNDLEIILFNQIIYIKRYFIEILHLFQKINFGIDIYIYI